MGRADLAFEYGGIAGLLKSSNIELAFASLRFVSILEALAASTVPSISFADLHPVRARRVINENIYG